MALCDARVAKRVNFVDVRNMTAIQSSTSLKLAGSGTGKNLKFEIRACATVDLS